MKEFNFKNSICFGVQYLPTKRCRTVRNDSVFRETDFVIKEIALKQAPTAFAIIKEDEGKKVSYYVRSYNNKLYKPVFNKGSYVEKNDILNYLQSALDYEVLSQDDKKRYYRYVRCVKGYVGKYSMDDKPLTDESILETFDVERLAKEASQERQKEFDKMLIINDYLYQECGEPRYYFNPDNLRNPRIDILGSKLHLYDSNQYYFNANQYDLVYKTAIKCMSDLHNSQVALRLEEEHQKGVNRIKVISPNLVKIDPQSDYQKQQNKAHKIHELYQKALTIIADKHHMTMKQAKNVFDTFDFENCLNIVDNYAKYTPEKIYELWHNQRLTGRFISDEDLKADKLKALN